MLQLGLLCAKGMQCHEPMRYVARGMNSLQLQHLVLHEGDERGDDHTDAPAVHRGELEAQTLSIAWRRAITITNYGS